MILHVLLGALLATAQGGLVPARTAYSKCLSALVKADAKEGTEAAAFATKVAAACKAEESAFRNAAVATDVAAKISRSTAEKNAADEISYIRDNAVETYKAYLEPPTPR